MVDDAHKFIVETETVEAPVSSLLMASTGAANNGAAGNPGGSKTQNREPLDHGVPPTAAKMMAASVMGPKNDASSSKKSYSGLLTGNSSVAHEGLSGSGAISGSNINLIDNNPLSPHVAQASVRNKKSSLLIDSSNEKKNETEDVPRGRVEGEKNGTTLRKHMEEIANANRDDTEGKNAADFDHGVSRSAQSSKTNTSVPTPLMLPVATHAIAGATVPPTSTVSATTGTQANKPAETKPSKIIERPPISATNSRDVLLEDEVRKKPVANNGPSAHADQGHAVSKKASTAHSEDIHHDLDSLQKPTKADFFAARLASAVGENEISDSEETFIYESAANSTKNAIAAAGFDSNDHSQQQQQHGIPSKMSVPVLNNNAKLLSRLKNTRHTSMSALPISASTKHTNELANARNEALATGTPAPNPAISTPNEEVASIKFPEATNGNKTNDLHSVRSEHSEHRSPDKRLSLTSVGKPAAGGFLPSNSNKNGHTPRKPSVSNSTLRHVSSSQAGAPRAKFNSRTDGDNGVSNKRNLRTTASKIFDANGAPPRRYSGVPDDVNLEDFIEQSNDKYLANSSIQRDERVKSYLEPNPGNDKRTSREMTEAYNKSAIQEEEGENDRDDDDLHSMFYYNHRGDLEARPQISDYEEDGEGIDDDNHDDNYYNTLFGNGYNGNGNTNYNHGRPPKFLESQFSPSDSHFPAHTNFNNGIQNPQFNANPNEQTPLRPRKHISRNQLSYSPHNFYTRKSSWAKVRHCVYFTFIVISLLTVGFILGFLLATNKELQGFNIVIMDNILSSSDELLFDITVTAFNPGFFAIGVQDVNMDIFAKSSHITKSLRTNTEAGNTPSRETILLGTVCRLETPLKFEGGFFKRSYDVSVSTVKLLDPGSKADPPDDDDDDDDDERKRDSQNKEDDVAKWKKLIQYDYELIVRGSMQYKIPFFRSNKSVAVQSSANVHPGKYGDEAEVNKFLLL